MSQVFSSLGSIFQGAAPAMAGSTAALGMVGNLINSIQRGQQISNLESAENKYTSLSPAQLSGLVTQATQPLNQNLLESVGNQVQANMAERGLAEAPGIFEATESQALAPYEQQNQQTALQLVLQQMGIPLQYASTILQGLGPQSNIAPLLQMLMLRQNNPSSSGGGGITPTTALPGYGLPEVPDYPTSTSSTASDWGTW